MPDLISEGAIEVLVSPSGDLPLKKVNKQLYENSSLNGSAVDALAETLTDGLYNARKPNLAIQHEKPEHRLVLLLKLKGFSNREIARQTGFSDAWVSQVTRQPWFQVALVKQLRESQEEIADQIIRVEATNSVFKLVQLRDTAKSEDVQARCAMDLLNRHLGKPIQRTETTINGGIQHTIARAEDIDEELKEIEAEERRLLQLSVSAPVLEGPQQPQAPAEPDLAARLVKDLLEL